MILPIRKAGNNGKLVLEADVSMPSNNALYPTAATTPTGEREAVSETTDLSSFSTLGPHRVQ